MAVTSPRLVTSGFFRNHLYVVLGLNVLASMAALSQPEQFPVWPAATAAALSYAGAVCWLYEAARPGRVLLFVIAGITLAGAMLTTRVPSETPAEYAWLWLADPITSGWTLGGVFTAMLLGHWYLNAPGMELGPLKRLIAIATIGTTVRLILWCVSLTLEWQAGDGGWPAGWVFWFLHGFVGLAMTLPVLAMSWAVLRIPNTQSATGILYVGVIFTFLGEVAGLLISAESGYPL